MSPPVAETKICERCGASFGCGVSTGNCWCMRVSLDHAALAGLREKYHDCLCETCLPQKG